MISLLEVQFFRSEDLNTALRIVNLSDGCPTICKGDLVGEDKLVPFVQSESIVGEILESKDLSTRVRVSSSESDTAGLELICFVLWCCR